MAEKRSESSTYPSKYSTGWVTPAQFIVEKLCENKARMEKKDLPDQFWQLPEWSKFFKQQIVTANQLLKHYHVSAVVAALGDKRAYRIYSLRAPHLIPIIQECQRIYDAKAKAEMARNEVEVTEGIVRPGQAFGNKTMRTKLKELDG